MSFEYGPAVVWRDKRGVCLLKNIHVPPREGNFCDEHGKAIKPAILADCNRQMGHFDNADRMASSYTANSRTWQWTKKLFFLPVRPGHSQRLHPSIFTWWEDNLTLRFSTHLNREMLARAGHEPWPSMPVGRTAPASTNIGRLDTSHNKHWPGRNPTKRRCRLCSAWGVTRKVMFRFVKCDVAFVWAEMVSQISTQRTIYNTSFRPSSIQTVEASITM